MYYQNGVIKMAEEIECVYCKRKILKSEGKLSNVTIMEDSGDLKDVEGYLCNECYREMN
ncbi:unnamed protein product [marine sediment metagenome]|uniref:Uncharacterized protein n=1 Tax=marine sediment metagenome TaxID=412755 RepID=X0WJE9_9ZZZZ